MTLPQSRSRKLGATRDHGKAEAASAAAARSRVASHGLAGAWRNSLATAGSDVLKLVAQVVQQAALGAAVGQDGMAGWAAIQIRAAVHVYTPAAFRLDGHAPAHRWQQRKAPCAPLRDTQGFETPCDGPHTPLAPETVCGRITSAAHRTRRSQRATILLLRRVLRLNQMSSLWCRPRSHSIDVLNCPPIPGRHLR